MISSDYFNNLSEEDTQSMEKFSTFLKEADYRWFSNFSMMPSGLLILVEEIFNNNRTHIIEFGSGASSIVMARAIKKDQLESNIISIESDPYFCDDLNNYASANRLDDIIRFIYAPLFPCPYMSGNKWYDYTILHSNIPSHNRFDMVVIDGPQAWNERIKLNRYGAIPFVVDYLAKSHTIFVDDANREGEKTLLKMWQKHNNITSTKIENRIAICRKERRN